MCNHCWKLHLHATELKALKHLTGGKKTSIQLDVNFSLYCIVFSFIFHLPDCGEVRWLSRWAAVASHWLCSYFLFSVSLRFSSQPFKGWKTVNVTILYKDTGITSHKLIWLYCSHCAYCRCFQKVWKQWHPVAALHHCNSAYQPTAAMPGGDSGCIQ